MKQKRLRTFQNIFTDTCMCVCVFNLNVHQWESRYINFGVFIRGKKKIQKLNRVEVQN